MKYKYGLEKNVTLELEKYLIGTSSTRSSSSLTTNSGTGATAFACGLKSYNCVIGMDSNRKPSWQCI